FLRRRFFGGRPVSGPSARGIAKSRDSVRRPVHVGPSGRLRLRGRTGHTGARRRRGSGVLGPLDRLRAGRVADLRSEPGSRVAQASVGGGKLGRTGAAGGTAVRE